MKCHQIVSSIIWPKFLYIPILGYFGLDNWYLNSFYWFRANCLGTKHIRNYFICLLLPVVLAVYYLFRLGCEMPTTQNSFLWAQLLVWFYHVRERIFIDLKFTWGFAIHTKRLVYIYISWLLATLSASSYNPNCLRCMYSNAASIWNPLILLAKER